MTRLESASEAVHVSKYVALLGVDVFDRERDLQLLTELQIAHLIKVPFNNLSVFHRREVRTDLAYSVAQITEGRGGWCFVVNGGFGWLLRELGFDVKHVECRVLNDDGWGPHFDHCASVVELEGKPWFVDVGFGDCPMRPIELADGDWRNVPRTVRCRVEDQGFIVSEWFEDKGWLEQLSGSWSPRNMTEFNERNDFLRTKDGLGWTNAPFATRATGADGSRVTLLPGLLKVREGKGKYQETPVDDEHWESLLNEHFGISDRLNR